MIEPSGNEGLDRRAHVAPELTRSRLDASWEVVRAGRRRKARAMPFAVAGGLVAAAAAALLAWVAIGHDDEGWAGTTFSTADEAAAVTLADGSSIEAEPHTELVLETSREDEVRVALRAGSATFEVARRPGRQFIVGAGAVSVRVVGTRFVVQRAERPSGERIAVEVERGIVEVRYGGRTRRLSAGERWTTEEQVTEVARMEEPREPAAGEARSDDRTGARETARRRPARPSRRAEPTRRGDEAAEAAELFERATTARRAGDAAEAARLYEDFLAAHPSNARAALAAFELGRLRMDSLDDFGGAATALRRALRMSPRSPFREDAMARLVRAYDRAGDRSACERARDDYLAAYAQGRYANDVRQRCD